MKFCVCVVSVVSFRFSNAAHLRRESILGSTMGVPLDAIAQESLAAAQASFDSAARPWRVYCFELFVCSRVSLDFYVEQGDQI